MEKARRVRLDTNKFLVNFNVTSLFINIFIAKALKVIGRRLVE